MRTYTQMAKFDVFLHGVATEENKWTRHDNPKHRQENLAHTNKRRISICWDQIGAICPQSAQPDATETTFETQGRHKKRRFSAHPLENSSRMQFNGLPRPTSRVHPTLDLRTVASLFGVVV